MRNRDQWRHFLVPRSPLHLPHVPRSTSACSLRLPRVPCPSYFLLPRTPSSLVLPRRSYDLVPRPSSPSVIFDECRRRVSKQTRFLLPPPRSPALPPLTPSCSSWPSSGASTSSSSSSAPSFSIHSPSTAPASRSPPLPSSPSS